MIYDRRSVLRGSLAFGLATAAAGPARPQAGSLFHFSDDHGLQVYNYRLPSDLSVEGLPGIVWAGSQTPDVILVEFFDYNCPYCRAAAQDLDALLAGTPSMRLGLVNNAILSVGSVQAAKVQQAILRSYGPAKAYAFHQRIYASRGAIDGALALETAKDLGFDPKSVETTADLPQVTDVVRRQRQLAEALGFQATPSFMLGSIGILGYPGPHAMSRALAAFRQCDKLICP